MGVDYEAYAIIGIPVRVSHLKEIKESLEPLGLWDESKFGLWAVMGAH